MGYCADIYVINQTRSRIKALQFLDHFIADRSVHGSVFTIPLLSKYPEFQFNDVNELMIHLESQENLDYSIYWSNLDKMSPILFGMIFYTLDSHMIFGISRLTGGKDSNEIEKS